MDHAPSALPLTESPGAPALVVPRSLLLPRWFAVVQAFLVCGILPTQLAIATVLVVFLDVPMLAGDGAISLHFLATLSLFDTALVALLIRVFLILSGEESRDVFLGRRPIWGEVWRGLALVPVVLIGVTAIVLALRAVAPWLQTVKESPISQYMQNPYDAAIFLVVGVLAGGVREELQRGFFLHRFQRVLGRRPIWPGRGAWRLHAPLRGVALRPGAGRRDRRRLAGVALGPALSQATVVGDADGQPCVLQRRAGGAADDRPLARHVTRDRRLWLLIALAFLLSLPAVTTRIYASDEIQYFSWLRSWAFDRDVNFENEYRYFYDTGAARNPDFHETFLERTNEAGRRINFAPIGTAILWAPFYAVGHVVALATGARADGLSAPYIAAVSYGSACYGFLAVWLSARIAGRIVGRGVLAAVVIWIGTPLVYYMYVTPPFSHACSAFAVALFITVWLRVRDSWSPAGAAWLGLTGALMAMVREQDIFFIAGPAIDFVWKALASSRPKAQGQGPSAGHGN